MGRRDRLDDAAIDAALRAVAWTRDGDAITRTLPFPSFRQAIDFVGAVADVAEALDHHPDIDIRWRTVTLRAWTHDRGGLTRLDFELAGRIDALAPAERRPPEGHSGT